MGKRWKTVKKIEASMENIGNDGKTYRNNRSYRIFFPIPKKKTERTGKRWESLWKTSPSWKHLLASVWGCSMTDLHI